MREKNFYMADKHSVNIILYNLSGLFMGPVAQIASMLAFPINDNLQTSNTLERAFKLMNFELDKCDDDAEFVQDEEGQTPFWMVAEPDQDNPLEDNISDLTTDKSADLKKNILKLVTDTSE